jgi:hypothetical protein
MFKNLGAMEEEYVTFLQDHSALPPEKERQGLVIIKRNLKELNWTLKTISSDGSTSITIGIPLEA